VDKLARKYKPKRNERGFPAETWHQEYPDPRSKDRGNEITESTAICAEAVASARRDSPNLIAYYITYSVCK